ncbi:MAG: sigma-70 family RNA polymerase sigma factor [Planctomycetia bacterium]|nr:sigma-70 family RNA polymerase sigma factor [Planctomycetia bacterium]
MADRTADDTELVARAIAGCEASLAALIARHQSSIVHYAAQLLARGGRRTDAEDVAQETFIRACRGLGGYESSGPFGAWLFAIARRTCLNHLRTERRLARRAAQVAGRTRASDRPDDGVIETERRQRLWEVARAALPEHQFTALWLRYVEEMPLADIAAVLQRSPGAVKLLLVRGRRRLEPLLADFVPYVPAGNVQIIVKGAM